MSISMLKRTTSKSDTISFKAQSETAVGSTDYITGAIKDLDVGLSLAAGHADDPDLAIEESKRLRRKLDRHLLPLLCAVYTVQFIDKGSLASASILGIIQDNHLSTDQFNTLSSAFYIGYLIFEWPQNWALQRFPVGRWITFNIFIWCIFMGLHSVCHNFGGLFILRFLLGASEGCMTTGLLLVTSMFYTRTEIAERIGWTFQFNGLAQIISGFIAFGVFHAPPNAHPNQWQWMMIVTTILTFFVFILFYFFFPDNPTTAYFLTEDEKIKVIKRVQGNQNGIETKNWKKYQVIETFKDPKTWIYFFWASIALLQSGIGVQYSIVIKSFGFSTLQTTLLNIPSGVTQIIGILLGCYALRRFPNSRAWIGVVAFIPNIIACLMEIFVPFENRVAHLLGIYLTNFGGSPGFIMVMSWVASTTSGHTKKMTTNAIFFVGYSLGQLLSTQFWKEKYRPRNILPWSITLASYVIDILVILLIRYMLVTENKRRDAMRAQLEASGESLAAFDDFAYVDTIDEKGNIIKTRVEKAMLDLTDRENLAFRYVL